MKDKNRKDVPELIAKMKGSQRERNLTGANNVIFPS